MVKLNREEILVGFIYGSSTWPLLSWLAVVPGTVCAFLWAIGGAGKKAVRRIGVPIIMAISLSFTSLWLLLTVLPLWGVVSIGYGMPSVESGDKGSVLGRFYLRLLPYKAANWATRFTVFVLFVVVMIVSVALVGK